ncbi:MAG: YicC/YloC family endoribonuclease [Limisphaerales bacterium]
MKSMTGYGRGECAQAGFKITVEVSSVNRKQSEIAVNLPRELELLEAQIRDTVNERVARGRVTVRVAVHAAEAGTAKLNIDTALAKAHTKELKKLAKALDIPDAISLDLLLRIPGVLQSSEGSLEANELWPVVQKATSRALDTLVSMREKEGKHLAKDLQQRVTLMREAVARVQKQAPEVAQRYRQQLVDRIKAAGLEVPGLDDERLIKEVFYFADRIDITEELTRLQSHFKQFDDCLKKDEPIGRTLDFLAQEMNREINTLGAKANDSIISREVVTLKSELERFREQVQNVE